MIIDFHTHVFPDRIAPSAIEKLQSASHIKAFSDGTLAGLGARMAEAGVDCSVVLPVATNERQVEHVNDASIAICEGFPESGVLSFGCMHPDFSGYRAELGRLAAAGIKGIKLHPVFQGCDFDDIKYIRILDRAGELGLIVSIHAGWDVGVPGVSHVSPRMIKKALGETGPLVLIAAHMGGWRCWDEAKELLSDSGIYIDTSFSFGSMVSNGDGYYKSEEELALLGESDFLGMISAFGSERVLFGTDSPWGEALSDLEKLRALPLREDELENICGGNAARLLGLE